MWSILYLIAMYISAYFAGQQFAEGSYGTAAINASAWLVCVVLYAQAIRRDR